MEKVAIVTGKYLRRIYFFCIAWEPRFRRKRQADRNVVSRRVAYSLVKLSGNSNIIFSENAVNCFLGKRKVYITVWLFGFGCYKSVIFLRKIL